MSGLQFFLQYDKTVLVKQLLSSVGKVSRNWSNFVKKTVVTK